MIKTPFIAWDILMVLKLFDNLAMLDGSNARQGTTERFFPSEHEAPSLCIDSHLSNYFSIFPELAQRVATFKQRANRQTPTNFNIVAASSHPTT